MIEVNIEARLKYIYKTSINYILSKEGKLDILSGKLGALLYVFEFELMYPQYSRESRFELLEAIFKIQYTTARVNDKLHVHSGKGGVIWLYTDLVNKSFLSDDIELNGFLDNFWKVFVTYVDSKDYDLFYGYISFFCLVKKHPRLKARFLSNFDSLWLKLKASFETSNEGIYLNDYTSLDNPGIPNLGLAHGLPSIIIFLLELYQLTGEKDIPMVIQGIVNYMESQKISDSRIQIKYPCVSNESDSSRNRIAWCYNDLGYSFSLAKAGHILKNEDYINSARDIAANLCKVNIKDSGVVDVGLCHGAFGVGLVFQRLNELLGDEIFLIESDKYFSFGHRLVYPLGNGYSFLSVTDKEFVPRHSFLSGAAGVGLSLLYREHGKYHLNWLDLLLLS